MTRSSDPHNCQPPPGWALVTGACSGIGLALARGLAERGHDLLLVSQRPTELKATAEEIARDFGVRTQTIVIDLARPTAAGELYAEVEARGLCIDTLVCNAGIFFFGEVADADPQRACALLQLHVVTPSLLCTLFARGMRTRRRGRILIVSSISAVRDFPSIAYYGSSKKYLRGFACALRSELAVYGIAVSCLLPGATATALYDSRVVPVELGRRLGVMMDPSAVASAGLQALFADQAECIPGAMNRVLVGLAARVPQRAIDLLRRHAPFLPPHREAGR